MAALNLLTRYGRAQFSNPDGVNGEALPERDFYSSEDEDEEGAEDAAPKPEKPAVAEMDPDHRYD
jgi:hypothetical protein